MATINGVVSRSGSGDVITVTWSNLTVGSLLGAPARFPQWSDRTIQFTGTFDTATAVLQGSNDGTNYETLDDVFGNALSFTAAGIKTVADVPEFMRPSLGAGAGSEDISVILVMRRSNDLRQ